MGRWRFHTEPFEFVRACLSSGLEVGGLCQAQFLVLVVEEDSAVFLTTGGFWMTCLAAWGQTRKETCGLDADGTRSFLRSKCCAAVSMRERALGHFKGLGEGTDEVDEGVSRTFMRGYV